MVTREQFRQVVRKMQDDGVPLTMANLMVRTELPRATIEDWLDDLQRGASFAKPERAAESQKDSKDGDASERSRSKLKDRAKSLKAEVVGDLVKQQLGLGKADDDSGSKGAKRELKVGGVLGLVLPPAGLAYSAPWPAAATGTAVYAVIAFLTFLFPLIGIPYLLIPMHLIGGLAGAAYAWRYNRAGKRTPLLPKGESKKDD